MSLFFVKVILYGLIPVLVGIFASIIWYLIYLYKFHIQGLLINLQLNIKVTFFIVVYLTYPTITNLSLQLFNCFTMEDGSFLRRDLSIQCKTPSQLKMALVIGIPYVAIWVIGFPVYVFTSLYRNRKKFDDKEIITKFGLFFVGLNDKAYFWEVIITNARKIIFIMCSTLLSTSTPVLKVSDHHYRINFDYGELLINN